MPHGPRIIHDTGWCSRLPPGEDSTTGAGGLGVDDVEMPRVTNRPDDFRLVRVRRLADQQGGVVSRRQLYAAGVTRWEIRGAVQACRWQRIGDQSICLHNGTIDELGHLWAAVFQGGPRACLDGSASLRAAGLERYVDSRIRVSVPRGARVRRNVPYDIRQTRRWSSEDIVHSGIPRTRAEVAAVRAALWAVTDKQATYVLTLVVQQGLATAAADRPRAAADPA